MERRTCFDTPAGGGHRFWEKALAPLKVANLVDAFTAAPRTAYRRAVHRCLDTKLVPLEENETIALPRLQAWGR